MFKFSCCFFFICFHTVLVLEMNNQEDQTRTHAQTTQGHETNHGVHACHKCEWPFPNPHPSSKQRRAHKKICGTIQGYKLLVSESQTHSNASDDEQHLSDDDPYSQGPNSLDTGNNEKVNCGTGENLTRSGDEVFLDAIANFSDSALSPGSKEPLRNSLDSATDVKIVNIKYQEFSGSSEFNATDANQLIVKSTDDDQMQDPSILQMERAKDGTMLEFQDQLYGSHVDPLSSSITGLKIVVHSDDYFVLSGDSNPSKAEATPDMLLENKIYTAENVRNCSLTSVAKETNLEENDEIKSDSDMIDIVVFSDNTVGEEMLETAVSDVVNSDCQVASGAFNLEEKNNAEFLSVIPQEEIPIEVKTSTNGVIVESAHMIQFATSGDVKTMQETGEGNLNMFTSPLSDNRDDVADLQNECADFEDHKEVVPRNSLSLPSIEAWKPKQDDLKDFDDEEDIFHINQSQMSEKREILPSDGHGLDSSIMKEQERCEVVAKEMHAEESFEVSKPAGSNCECPILSEVVMDMSSWTQKSIDCANKSPLSGAQEDIKDNEINSSCRVEKECNRFISTFADSHQTQDAELVVTAAKDIGWNYSSLYTLNVEPSAQCNSVDEDTQEGEHGREVSEITVVPVQDQSSNTNNVHLPSSTIHACIDYGVQCDSLDGNQGSVSGKSILKDPKAASKRQQCEKPDMYEAPSFMTLVEPGHVVAAPGVQNGLNQHPSSTSLQSGWFPTLTQVTTNESHGRKRNEEMIAKITNNRTSKQHTPLQSPLVSEAAHSNKPKSPKWEENSMIRKNGESPATKALKGEGGKGWNSSAKYSADNKRQNKKLKSKPNWIPFVCCSSCVDSPQR